MRKYDVEEAPNLQLAELCDSAMAHYEDFKIRYLAIKPHLSNVADQDRDINFVYSDPPYRNEHGQKCRLIILFRIECSPEIDQDSGEILEKGLVKILIVRVKLA